MGSIGQVTHCTLVWSLVRTLLPEVPVWKDEVSPGQISRSLGALTDKCACIAVNPRVPYPAACPQTSLHLPTLAEVTEPSHPAIFPQGVAFRFRTAPAKAAVVCLKTGTFSNGFAPREAISIRREKMTIGGLLFLGMPWQDSSELILQVKLPGKGVSLTCIHVGGVRRHLYDFSSSFIRPLNYCLCNLIICRSCVILFPYEKGT